MVSVAVSKLGCMGLVFIEPGVKVNGLYYWGILLSQELVPAICHITDDMYVFLQDSAPAHRAHETIKLLCRETRDFIGPDLWHKQSGFEPGSLQDLRSDAGASVLNADT